MTNTFRISDNLTVDIPFKDFLSCNSNRIAMMIMSFRTMEGINYIGTTDKPDVISFLPPSKQEYVEQNYLDPYSDGIGRAQLKVGRLVFKLFPKKLLNEYIQPTDIEDFVNSYKSFFDVSNHKLTLVKGEEMRKYYLENNYSMPEYGSLWKSCMRQYDRQMFLDLYVQNEDKVSMLVLLSTDDGAERVRGRALLWEAEDLDGNKLKIMDRIYTIFDSDVYIFKKWARENGYITKLYQNAKSHNLFEDNGKEMVINLKMFLPNHKLNYYPYLDTFPYYDGDGNFYNNHKMPYEYVLVQSNGGLYPPDPVDDDDAYDEYDEQYVDYED